MVMTYGVPVTYSGYSNLSLGWDDCVKACYSNINCIPFLSYTEPYWTLPTCPENFTLFSREKGYWCLKLALQDTCLDRNQSITACANTYGGIMSGIENKEEFNFLADESIELNKEISDGYAAYFLWVNGDRKSTCMPPKKQSASCNGTNEFTFTDPTLSSNPQGYVWLDSQPDGLEHPTTPPANCLCLKCNTNTFCGIDDCSCVSSSKTGSSGYCFKGYACGVQLQLF
uniref:CW domain-containing protein n=2 Tax=Caenorhabditis japonica TaxID=281687 RepID=A0A8R1DY40_CAEJA